VLMYLRRRKRLQKKNQVATTEFVNHSTMMQNTNETIFCPIFKNDSSKVIHEEGLYKKIWG
jgi:hypothetical protein